MEGDPRNPKVSLLKKYDIPIDHLTYEYVEKCSEKKELEKIIRILRSGEEGSYPDLLKFTEERLRKFAPDSRVLRVEVPALTKDSLSTEEWSAVENELLSWEEEMKVMDTSLDFEKSRIHIVGNKNMPGVRQVVQPTTTKSVQKKVKEQAKNERIRSGDYAAWEKFDVDKELLKMDVEEERKQEEKEKKKRELKKQVKEKKIEIEEIDKESYSSTEHLVLANQAKDRGNECYKSGDLENALKYYNISINFCGTANAYNNRAMTYLKLKEYQKAVDDCNKVLELSKNNVKALLRRATAYQNMSGDDNNNNNKNINNNNNFDELALQDLYKIVLLEPNNKVAQIDLQNLKKKLNIDNVGKKFRMPIFESGDDPEMNSTKFEVEKKSTWNVEEDSTPIDHLPLTYYGPSTSTFQCEPYSRVYLALSGSTVPGEILCKCNSYRTRQNPLCQKCGEAMSTPKPSKKSIAAKSKTDSKPNSENENKAKIQLNKDQLTQPKKADISNETNTPKEKVKIIEVEKEKLVVEEEKVVQKVEALEKEKVVNDKPHSHNAEAKKLEKLDCLIEKYESSENKVDNLKSNNKVDKVEVDNNFDMKNSIVNSEIEEVVKASGPKIDENNQIQLMSDEGMSDESTKKDATENTNLNCNNVNSETKNSENSSSHDNVNHTTKKSKKQKKKSKEPKEVTLTDYPKPVKIVHAAKYLHPTSVEPKIKNESAKEPSKQLHLSSSCQFKDFVPNNRRSVGDSGSPESPGGSWITSTTKTSKYQNDKVKLERIMSDLSLEGNKENISDNKNLGIVEITDRETADAKKEVVDSGFEFIKTWEELKKIDETYAKRAEIIRMLKPNDLGKVIGIKLDSDMLSCLLNCLERHFIENDPKVVVEFLKQLPKIPRFGLVSMFLAENDKKVIKKLIDTAENKGIKLDEDTKKELTS